MIFGQIYSIFDEFSPAARSDGKAPPGAGAADVAMEEPLAEREASLDPEAAGEWLDPDQECPLSLPMVPPPGMGPHGLGAAAGAELFAGLVGEDPGQMLLLQLPSELPAAAGAAPGAGLPSGRVGKLRLMEDGSALLAEALSPSSPTLRACSLSPGN